MDRKLLLSIIYFSRSGNTAKMASAVAEGASLPGLDVRIIPAEQADNAILLESDAIILGSPVYYGHPAWPLKKVIDESITIHTKLTGKVGGAFTSGGGIGGGTETTIRSLTDALLIHGMIVQGVAYGAHYGPAAVGTPDNRALSECRELGERIAKLTLKLKN